VLRVAHGDIEELDVRGVALEVQREEGVVVLDVRGVQRQAHSLVDVLQRRAAALEDGDHLHGVRPHARIERRQRGSQHHLRHSVVHELPEGARRSAHRARATVQRHAVPAVALDALHRQPDAPHHAHSVRAERGFEAQPGPSLNHES